MRPLREYIDPGGQVLTRRLDQFCAALEKLGERLRSTIAESIGQTIGGIVRDTAFRVLDEITGYIPGSSASDGESLDDEPAYEDYEPDYWADINGEAEPIPQAPLTAPATPVSSERLPTALSAGLQTASWWLKRCTAQSRVITTLAVGLAATGIAYLGGPVAALVLNLVGAATQFNALSGVLAASDSPASLLDSP